MIVGDVLSASEIARLPEGMHHSGPPTRWAAMTRPSQALHSFLEAPVHDGSDLLICDVAGGRVLRLSGDDWSVEHQYDGAPHAMRLIGGRAIVADYWHGLIEMTGQDTWRLLHAGPDGARFLGLSDMALAPDGAIWLTDSGRSSQADPVGSLYRVPPDLSAPQRAATGIAYPNGVALSPDGAWVYVAETRANAVQRLSSTLPDNGLPMRGVHLHLSGGLGPDGLAIGPQGHLAVAQAQAGRAFVFDHLGDPIATIRLPQGTWTTSVAFDPDGRLLIVEAERGAIWAADPPEPMQ
ncbi:MAG: SMP-30/gluconolactonase/LRE family protein [Pseudomonadota bacterium]